MRHTAAHGSGCSRKRESEANSQADGRLLRRISINVSLLESSQVRVGFWTLRERLRHIPSMADTLRLVASSQTDTLIGGGVALATIGGVLMGIGASENSGSRQVIWIDPWFAGGCALVACGVVLVVGLLSQVAVRAKRRSRRGPTIRELAEQHEPLPPVLGVGLGALIPDTRPDQPREPNPIALKLVDEDWRLVGGCVWVAGLKVRMVNVTDEPIELTHYYVYTTDLTVDDTLAGFPEVSDGLWDAIGDAEAHLEAVHKGEIYTPKTLVLPLKASTAWFIGVMGVPIPEQGRPWCKLRIKDSLGNAHELVIQARPAKTYQS